MLPELRDTLFGKNRKCISYRKNNAATDVSIFL